MPINVGYQTEQRPTLNLAELQMEQRKYNYLKQQQNQKQLLEGIQAIAGIIKQKQREKKNQEILEQARKEGKQVTKEYDSKTGEWGFKIEEPKQEKMDFKSILPVIAGLQSPEGMLSQKQIQGISPYGMGQVEGGQVLAPEGTTLQDGQMLSPTGGRVGEYLEGYEPSKYTPAVPNILGQKLGVTKEEALRETLGLPQAKKTQVKIAGISPTSALAILSDPLRAQNLKRNNPEYYNKLKEIVDNTFGINILKRAEYNQGSDLVSNPSEINF